MKYKRDVELFVLAALFRASALEIEQIYICRIYDVAEEKARSAIKTDRILREMRLLKCDTNPV